MKIYKIWYNNGFINKLDEVRFYEWDAKVYILMQKSLSYDFYRIEEAEI